MPSLVSIPSGVTFKPGVYANVDTSALSGRNVATGVIAVVSNWDFLKQNTVYAASSPAALRNIEPDSSELQQVADVLFSPANDTRVPGAPSQVLLVSPGATTQASFDFTDGTNAVLTMKASNYGPLGNNTKVKIAANAVAGQDITVSRGDRSEIFERLGETKKGQIQGLSALYGAATFEVSQASSSAARTMKMISTATIDEGTTATPTNLFMLGDSTTSSGMVEVKASANIADKTVTIEGFDSAGAPQTATALITDTPYVTARVGSSYSVSNAIAYFSSITSIAVPTLDGGGETAGVRITNFALTDSNATNLKKAFDKINDIGDGANLLIADIDPSASNVKISEIDIVANTSIDGANVDIFSKIQDIVNGMANSGLVEVTAKANEFSAAPQTYTNQQLGGGTYTEYPTAANWQSALEALESIEVNIVVPLADELTAATSPTKAAVHLKVRDHLVKMAGLGANERQGYVGGIDNETKANLKSAVKALNSQYLGYAVNGIKVFNPAGNQVSLKPDYAALMLASIQASTPVGTPLSQKIVNVIEPLNNSGWSATTDANEMIQSGLIIIEPSRVGYRVVRSVSSYLTDDNPILSEMSSMESVITSIRDLRANLDSLIGAAAVAGTAKRISAIARTRLEKQVKDGIIKAFDSNNLTVEDIGDHFRLNVRVARVEPVNFITIKMTVDRISESA